MISKKIIALSCSPSKGRNSDTMLDHFILGIENIEGLEVEKVYLEDILIDHYNYQNRSGAMSHEDDFRKLIEKIEGSNGLVIATPTYNFSVPAHLKNFIDRIRFISLDMNKKTRLGQPAGKLDYLGLYFVVSGGTPLWAQKLLFFAFPPFWLRAVFLYYGARVLGAYYSGDTKSFENNKILKSCRKCGEKYAKMILEDKRNGILERIFFRPPQE